MNRLPPPTTTDAELAGYPLVLTAEHMERIYGRSTWSLRKAVRDGVGVPAPLSVSPMRWLKSSVVAHLEGRLTVAAPSKKLRRVK